MKKKKKERDKEKGYVAQCACRKRRVFSKLRGRAAQNGEKADKVK